MPAEAPAVRAQSAAVHAEAPAVPAERMSVHAELLAAVAAAQCWSLPQHCLAVCEACRECCPRAVSWPGASQGPQSDCGLQELPLGSACSALPEASARLALLGLIALT